MSLLSFHCCCLHPAASCMNSHCQQYDLAVGLPHTGSDPLRRVRFTVGAHCTLVFDIYVGCSAPNLFFISDLRFQTRCSIFAAHWNFFLALNVCSSFNDCPSHLIDSTQFHASLKLYCDWFTPYYVIVHVIVVCLPHLFCEFQNEFYVWFYGGRTCF